MIKFINNKNQVGITLFLDFIGLIFHKSEDKLFNSYAFTFRIYKIDITLSLGKETKDVKNIRQNLKESKNHDAFA
tara:strand:- start:12076 stop:12300 length:225 start_codon:yes stop_codon:yes gene_type:complete